MSAPTVQIAGRRVSSFQICGGMGALAWLAVALTGARLRDLALAPVALLAGVAVLTFLFVAVGTALVVGQGRLTWYHQHLAILGACALTLAAVRAPVAPYLDVIGPAFLAFNAVGRLGCAAVGCCHGRPCSRGITYGFAHVAAGLPRELAGVRLAPVQLIEAGWSALLCVACMAMLTGDFPAGSVLVFSLVGYATGRFWLEGWRGDHRPRLAGLSEPQWTSALIGLAAGVAGLVGVSAVTPPLAVLGWSLVIPAGWQAFRGVHIRMTGHARS